MGNQKEFIQQVEKLKNDFAFASEMAIMINADRLSHLEKITDLELKLSRLEKDNDWIDVNDRLPEEGGRYWCYVRDMNDLGVSHFQWNCAYNANEKRFSDSTLLNGEQITHWRPLAKPPIFKQQKDK